MKNIFKLLLLNLIGLMMINCAAPFYKGGYLYEQKGKSYFGNDQQKIYINFSEKFHYGKIGFNANDLSTNDLDLAKEFNISPEKILFSYHSSSGKEMMAFLLGKNEIDLNSYQKLNASDSLFYFKTIEKNKNVFRENIYPFKKQFVKIIEKSPDYLDKYNRKDVDDKTKIFPQILTEKPN